MKDNLSIEELDLMEWTEETPGGIEMLPISLLFPHPNNPRKELGDLAELVASIKKNGVMQNLTVVKREGGGYTVIIGHRRCAAAKKAGLADLPCVIADLDEREQMGIMLAENMQRVDLTVMEQAQSMQMMLDLGETVETVADKTGLSKKTVKDRLKLNKLDQKALAKAIGKQITLTDLLKLDEIEDEKVRNDVLAKAGTNNFNDAYKTAMVEQEKQKSLERIVAHVKTYCFEKPQGVAMEDYRWRGFISAQGTEKKIESDLREMQSKYAGLSPCYSKDRSGVTIYSKRTKEEAKELRDGAAAREHTARLEALRDELWAVCARHYELRLEWMKNAKIANSDVNELMQEYFAVKDRHYNSYYYNADPFADVICRGKEKKTDAVKRLEKQGGYLLFCLIYEAFHDSEKSRPYNWGWERGHFRVTKCIADHPYYLMYAVLERWGYPVSDEERAILDGTHPAYLACVEFQEREYGV